MMLSISVTAFAQDTSSDCDKNITIGMGDGWKII